VIETIGAGEGNRTLVISLEGYQSDNHVNGAVDMISVRTRLDAVQENDPVHLRLDEAEPPALLRGSSEGLVALSTSSHTYSAVAPPIELEDDGVVPPLVLKARQMGLDI
jgi:hypothetical protein